MPSCVVPWLNSVCPRLSTRRRPWLSTSSRSRDDSAWNSGGGPASSALLSLNSSACQAPAWDNGGRAAKTRSRSAPAAWSCIHAPPVSPVSVCSKQCAKPTNDGWHAPAKIAFRFEWVATTSTPQELAQVFAIPPDGRGLPPGKGTYAEREKVYAIPVPRVGRQAAGKRPRWHRRRQANRRLRDAHRRDSAVPMSEPV